MKAIKYIFLMLAVCMALTASAFEETLTFVRTDGTTVTFSTDGLKITFDNASSAIISNAETSGATVNLGNVDYMCFGEVEAHVNGDVNGDGEVNIADVNSLIDLILNGKNTSLADVNGDGEVNIADVNAVIDIILNN